MISNKALSVFIFHRHQIGICNKIICSIQEIMGMSETAFKKYKKVCDDFPNINILTKIVTPDEV